MLHGHHFFFGILFCTTVVNTCITVVNIFIRNGPEMNCKRFVLNKLSRQKKLDIPLLFTALKTFRKAKRLEI
jgi:hypothetical protein